MDPQPEYDRRSERRTVARMLIGCGILVAGGLALGIERQPMVTAVELGDLRDAQLVEIRDPRGVTVVSGELRARRDLLGNTEMDAALRDRRDERVIGEVEVEIPVAGRENRRPELEVDIIGLAPRTAYTVVIDDRAAGRFTTDDRGSIDMELQEGEVPQQPVPTLNR